MAVTSEDAEARGEANSSEEEYNIEEATQDTLFLQRQGTTPEQTRDDRRAPPAGEETNKWQDDENENDSDDENFLSADESFSDEEASSKATSSFRDLTLLEEEKQQPYDKGVGERGTELGTASVQTLDQPDASSAGLSSRPAAEKKDKAAGRASELDTVEPKTTAFYGAKDTHANEDMPLQGQKADPLASASMPSSSSSSSSSSSRSKATPKDTSPLEEEAPSAAAAEAPRDKVVAEADEEERRRRGSPSNGNPKEEKQEKVHANKLQTVYRIKDLDTGTEFVVDASGNDEYNKDGSGSGGLHVEKATKIRQVDTGEEITMAQFEKNIGLQSPLMREMDRRDDRAKKEKDKPPKLVYSSDEDGEAVRQNRNQDHRQQQTKKKWFQKGLKTLKSKALNAGDALAETFRSGNESKVSTASSASNASVEQHHHGTQAHEEEFWHPGGKVGKQVKVNVHKKIYKEFTDLRLVQEIGAHKGAVWSMKFSDDGMYLASAGQDEIVRIWQVREDRKGSSNASSSEESSKVSKESKKPRGLFHEKPYRIYGGHKADILDLCWSKTQFLLSSSMDKTVRLWHISMNECLRVFSHTDFVTSIQFHPIDDKYFLSGSLDEKVRLWSIPEQTVVDWVNIHEMVTAVCFSPDGKKAVIGSYKGKCRFYSVEGNQFEYITQMDVKNTRGKNSRGKKITGLQYMPGVDRFLLVTSNDSRIRMYDGFTLCCKYKGHRNANSQIASGFSPGGGFIACGSEDGCVCIWSTINTFIPSVNPFYTGYRSDKNSSFETFLAHDDIVTSAVFAPLQDDPETIARNLGIAPPTKAAEALVKPSLKRLGLNKSKADQEREEAQRAGETAMKAAAAVGQNIVTAGFSGEIRIFENAGLPIWL